MKILLINHYAGSVKHGMEFRPYYLAKEWVRGGHEVTIVAANFSHVRSFNPVDKKNGEIEIIDGIRYCWLKTPQYRENDWRRILNICTFLFRLFRSARGLRKRGPYDAVIASSTYPLDIFPARRIARKSRAMLIFEVHDLWPLSPMELGAYSKRHPYIKLLQIAEDYAYKHSHRVVSLLPKAQEYMVGRGMAKEKFTYMPNFVHEESPPGGISQDMPNTLHIPRDKILIGYLGTMGLANCLENLLRAAERLNHDEDIIFVLVGDGPEKAKLERYAASKNLKRAIFHGPIPKAQVPALLSRFDACYIGLMNRPIFRMGISPNKLFDYMAAGKPVLYAINAGNDMVREAGCGISIEPENPQELVMAILRIKAMSESERAQMGENGRRYVMRNHTCRVIASRFLQILQGGSPR